MSDDDDDDGKGTAAAHAFQVLRNVSSAAEPSSLADLAKMMDAPASNIHRTLLTLEEAGYIERYQGLPRYVAGSMVYHLARALISRFPIKDIALRALRVLSQQTRGAATLNVRLGWYCLRLVSTEGPQEFYESRRVGEVRLLHEGVAPLAVLAKLDDASIAAYRRFVVLHYPDRADLVLTPGIDRLTHVLRKEGFVTSTDIAAEPCWVSAPILDMSGAPFASVSAALPLGEPIIKKKDALARFRETAQTLQETVAARVALAECPFGESDLSQLVLDLPALDERETEVLRRMVA
jgi:DNA-binding IclR family transcriptional regulator